MPTHPPLRLDTHEALVTAMPEILRRLDAEPEQSHLLLVNPLLRLEDVGVTLAPDLEAHVRRTLGFPKRVLEQITAVRQELRKHLAVLGGPEADVVLPKTPSERAKLVFGHLRVAGPEGAAPPDALTVEGLRPYRDAHPAVALLYKLGRLERGTLGYATRGEYEAHRAGRSHHPWIRRLRFRTGG